MTVSMPRMMLHLEGLAMLAGTLALYAHVSGDWGAFLALILVPDLSWLAYGAGVQVGSVGYNLVHFIGLPVLLGLLALAGGWTTGLSLALIWAAHISADRLFGYGFKYPTEFKDTHMGHV